MPQSTKKPNAVMMSTERKLAARKFADFWKGKGYEKGQSQPFWLSLLGDVLGTPNPAEVIEFEDQVKMEHTSFIDGYIPSTRVLIEQKSLGKDLDAPIKQSDGSLLTPFQQAKKYIPNMPLSKHPRWVVTSNFEEFRIYDMERPNDPAEVVPLADLEHEIDRMQFLTDVNSKPGSKDVKVSLTAGEIVGKVYDALLAQYIDPDSAETKHALNVLCVRLVFCLYAESSAIFGKRNMFGDYLRAHKYSARDALIRLFEVLDQREEDRDPYLDDDLAAFPYVNGGLFRTPAVIPKITPEIVDLILQKTSDDFKWRDISPTIFGAIFESTLNPETRRSGGMHYTSVENIHKVIDPLFLDELRAELEKAQALKTAGSRKKRLNAFRDHLASLKFLDPACGSGNFLTETYLSLRRLENDAIRALSHGQIEFAETNPVRVSIEQFYGIEINDFAVTVAQTALWIAESQMLQETEAILNKEIDYLPLTTAARIVEGNALRMDWNDVVPAKECSYVMGNPPFVGYTYQKDFQRRDLEEVFREPDGKRYRKTGRLDYVTAWFMKTAQYIQESGVRAAFVSTNSITQGEQVPGAWKPIFQRYKVHIDFAYRPFKWGNEAVSNAHVHVVIIGFSTAPALRKPRLYTDGLRYEQMDNINAYLLSASNLFIENRRHPLCEVPPIVNGSKPADGGYLSLSEQERIELLEMEPGAAFFIHPYVGSSEYINKKKRWCLWLVDVDPGTLQKMQPVYERVKKVQQFRLDSTKEFTRKSADYPTLFQQIRQPDKPYLILPRVSSEKRRYIPFGFEEPDTIINDSVQAIPGGHLYELGILSSVMHMAWVRAFAGRLKSDYRYSAEIVYNNFPWPDPTPKQKTKIEQTAQAILDARALYPDASLADLYDEVTMPPELREAHQDNDRAVMKAYGLPANMTEEPDVVAHLMKLYQKLANGAGG